MQKKRDERTASKYPGGGSSWELETASDKDKHALSRRNTENAEPAALNQSQNNSSKPPDGSERWTREEYQALIDRALRDYAAASSTTVAEVTATDSKRGLRGGDKGDDEGTESGTTDDVTDQLDRKPAARPRMGVEPRQIAPPQENDVLFGRSKHQKNHKGNQNLRKLCDEQRKVYDFADRDDKTEISRGLVKKIASIGGRFLKFHTLQKVWVEVSDQEARLKVAHTMRDGRPQPLGRLEPEMFPPIRCKISSLRGNNQFLQGPMPLTFSFHLVHI